MKKIYLLLVIALPFLASSCSKQEPIEIKRDYTSQTLPVGTGILAPSSLWYQSRLEQLGFFVFPQPEELPAFVVSQRDGVMASLDNVKGQLVLLNFWATWCPPCRAEMPSIEALYKKTRDIPFTVMAVSVAENPATVEDFLANNPYTFPIYLDERGHASSSFVTRGIPTTFILDKQGRAIAGMIGSRSYDGPEMTALIRELAERLYP